MFYNFDWLEKNCVARNIQIQKWKKTLAHILYLSTESWWRNFQNDKIFEHSWTPSLNEKKNFLLHTKFSFSRPVASVGIKLFIGIYHVVNVDCITRKATEILNLGSAHLQSWLSRENTSNISLEQPNLADPKSNFLIR